MNVVTPLRLVEPLGLYFRAGRNDHTALAHVLAAGPPQFTGVVLDASHGDRQKDLLAELAQRRFAAVLDPMAMELATAGGWERPRLRALAWAGNAMHEPRMFGNAHRFRRRRSA